MNAKKRNICKREKENCKTLCKSIKTAQRYLDEFRDVDGADISALQDAYEHARWDDVRSEALKLAQMKRGIIEDGIAAINKGKDFGEVDVAQLQSILKAKDSSLKAMQSAITSAKGYKKLREFDRHCFANHVKWTDRFLNPNGSKITYEDSSTAHLADTSEARLAYIRGKITEVGRYEVYCQWESEGAHVFIVEKTKDGDLLWFDPQSGHRGKSIQNYVDKMRSDRISVVRIDDKIINPKFASRLIKARK